MTGHALSAARASSVAVSAVTENSATLTLRGLGPRGSNMRDTCFQAFLGAQQYRQV
jgi:hypothetical protein